MSEVLEANVFFFITALSVIVVTVFLCFALYHLIHILRNVRKMSEIALTGAETLSEDLAGLREGIKDKARQVSAFLGFIRSWMPAKKPKRKKAPDRGKATES